MKIVKAINTLKDSRITLCDAAAEGEPQWITNGAVFYPLYGLAPEMTPQELAKTYDIDEDKTRIIAAKLPSSIAEILEDGYQYGLGIEECRFEPLGISFRGLDVTPIMTPSGIAFVSSKYLAPLEIKLNDEQITIDRVKNVFVIKRGMTVLSVICPQQVVSPEFVDKLAEVLDACQTALDKRLFTAQ